jgi:hypothetical protein
VLNTEEDWPQLVDPAYTCSSVHNKVPLCV